jgi:predicted ThiF/HesA family dinucleotide-utilizing enzyme
LRRGVVQHDRRIHLIEKPRGRLRIVGHDRIGVVRAMALDEATERGPKSVSAQRCA